MTPTQKGKQKGQRRKEYLKARKEAQVEGGEIPLPQKRFFRQRAHANVFSDHLLDYPISPAHMNWATHFPAFMDSDPTKTTLTGARRLVKDVEVADIGCGFGGLLVGLAPLMPETLMIGMEIRSQVTEYLQTRILALRNQQSKAAATGTARTTPQSSDRLSTEDSLEIPQDAPSLPQDAYDADAVSVLPGGYQNISALRANTMRYLPNFFKRHQLSKIFICFPDPHFKVRKHKARIVSASLNAEYAYVLRPGGLLYTITDVEDYHRWVLRHFGVQDTEEQQPQQQQQQQQQDVEDKKEVEEAGGEDDEESGVARVKELFERVSDEDLQKDECVRVMMEETEEGKKVTRNNGKKFVAVFRRLPDPEWVTS